MIQIEKKMEFKNMQEKLKICIHLSIAIVEKKNVGWVGFQKSYVIFRLGHDKCLRLLTRWVGGVKKGRKHAYVIFEWSLINLENLLLLSLNSEHLVWVVIYFG